MSTFLARYPGRCASCSERIEPGDNVTYTTDDELVHADCTADEPPPGRPAVVCPRCWLTQPCGCEED